MPEQPTTHRLTLHFVEGFGDPVWEKLDYELQAPDHNTGEWILGRSPTAQLTLNLRTISARHAVISYSYANDCWSISDLGSENGTYLNGKRVAPPKRPQPITIGDRIDLGPRARIQVVENAQDTVPEHELGPPTVASTTPIETTPPAPPAPAPAPAPLPHQPKTQWDSLYLAFEWLMSGTSIADRLYRLLVFGGLAALVVWLISVLFG
ncbi:FHA domain-containing protein [Nodosilinea sp. AN01ver1]|uniref:FHA domain-containing protein n=1 Tax=Nodosilinea sp. AN01ver1 TaxID=3423362 RepID=UPI003D3143F2